MFGRKQPTPAVSIVSQDAREALPGAREALAHLRETIRYYPPLYRTSEYQACQQTLAAMIGDLETLAGEGVRHG